MSDDKPTAQGGSTLVRVMGQWLHRRSEGVAGAVGATAEGSDIREPLYEALFGKDVIGVFFAGAWDPASCAYLPQLAQLYRTLLASDDTVSTRFEVVFASCDRDESSFEHFFANMPWLAIPFNDRERVTSLQQRFGAHTLPMLVLIDADANLITRDGRHRIAERPLGFPWHRPSISSIVDGDAYVHGPQPAEGMGQPWSLAGRAVTDGWAVLYFFGAKWSEASMASFRAPGSPS